MNKEILARIRAVYPGAISYEVVGRDVWVHCAPLTGGRRDIPGGTVRLGTSPTTAAIEAEILEAAK